jgi:hypothetical protein
MILAKTEAGIFEPFERPLAIFPFSVPALGPANIDIAPPTMRFPWELQMTVNSTEHLKIGPIGFVLGHRVDIWTSGEVPPPPALK